MPKTQSLITSPSHHRTPVRTHRQIKDTVRVSFQRNHSPHTPTVPNCHLVLRISMGTHQLLLTPAKNEITNLRVSLPAPDSLSSEGVSKFDGSIGCSTSRGKEPMLVGRPGDCFDSSLMVMEFVKRGVRVFDPDEEGIVIAS